MLPRYKLPQIPKESLPQFVRYMHTHGIEVEKGKIRARDLKPIQKSVNKEKVKNMLQDKSSTEIPIIITKDHFIIDGHHRWLTQLAKGEHNIKCIMLQCSLPEALDLANNFEEVQHRPVHEISEALIHDDYIVRKTLWHPKNEATPLDAAPTSVGDDDENADAENLLNKDGYGYISKYTDYGTGMVPGTM